MNCIYHAVRRATFIISFLSILFLYTMRQHVIQGMILPLEFCLSVCLSVKRVHCDERDISNFFVYSQQLPGIVQSLHEIFVEIDPSPANM